MITLTRMKLNDKRKGLKSIICIRNLEVSK